MSKKYLVPIDMNQNEIQNAVMQPLATAPGNPKIGQYYYNSNDLKMYQWNGSAWVTNGVKYTLSLGTVSATGVTIVLSGDDGTNSSATLPLATGSLAGLMSPAQYEKLDGIATGANKYTHPTTAGNKHLPSGGEQEQVLVWSANGEGKWGVDPENVTQTGSEKTADTFKLLLYLANGDILVQPFPMATNDAAGMLNATGYAKLAGIEDGAQANVIEGITFNGTTLTPTNKIISIDIPKEQFLDQAKTAFVDSFTWSSTTYPGSTDPGLNGKPVLVLAVKDEDGNVTYSFLNMQDLVEAYTGDGVVVVSGSGISHADSGASAGSYGNSANKTPGFGSTFNVPYVTVNAKGHVTGIANKTVKIPNAVATTSAAGLMSAADKQELINLSSGYTCVLAAGSTSVSIDTPVAAYIAYDRATGEEVMIDCSISLTGTTFSIATAYANYIDILYFKGGLG